MNLTSSRTEQLIHVPERHKVVETLGWQPGIWGGLFIVVGCLFSLNCKWPLTALEWEILGPSTALGLGLVGYEVWRRRNRTVLVRDGEHIAVFRRGLLDLTIAPSEITRVQAGLDIMLKVGVPFGVCAIIFTTLGIMGLLRDKAVTADNLIILSLGLACWASLASAAWTRFSCAHLWVPIKGSKWLAKETVLVPSSRLKELFP
ncbi:MAG: hypothetical protein MUO24_06565 [Desulfobacterales bacterium]|nr:hypothetical protein [Desulfobacterales bacterium]